MVRKGLLRGTFGAVLVFAFLPVMTSQKQYHVDRTDRFLFAYNDDGKVLWKTSIEKGGGGMYGLPVSYLEFPRAVRWYDGTNGRLLHELKFDRDITSSVGIDNVLKIRLGRDSMFIVVDRWTANIIGTEPFKRPERPAFVTDDPVRPLIDSLLRHPGKDRVEDLGLRIEATSKWILAFDQDVALKWKFALPTKWRDLMRTENAYPDLNDGLNRTLSVILKKDIIGLDAQTGKSLYQKSLPADFDYSSFGNDGIVYLKLKDGHWYQFTPHDGEVVLIK